MPIQILLGLCSLPSSQEWGMTPAARGSSALLSDEADQNFYGRLLGRKAEED